MPTHIHVALPSDAPIPEEALAAEDLGNGLWRLQSAPFVAYDLCRGDTVRCETQDPDRATFIELVQSAGAHTVRLLLAGGLDLMGTMGALLPLREFGCVAEDPKGRYYALTAGPDVDFDALMAHLDAQSESGVYEFEVFGSSTTG